MKKFIDMKIGEDVEFYALVESTQNGIHLIKVLIIV